MISDSVLFAVFSSFKLTTSELNVAKHLLGGQSNAQIAASLALTERTIKCHATSIYKKTNVTSRPEFMSKFLSLIYEREIETLKTNHENQLFVAAETARTRVEIVSAWNDLSLANSQAFSPHNLKRILIALQLGPN